jgi:ABC-type transport system substrate-binding protein
LLRRRSAQRAHRETRTRFLSIIEVLDDPLAAAQFGDTVLAAQTRKGNADLSLQRVVAQAPNWIYFPDQWDPTTPWHDLRVRQAASLALDRDGMNEALFLGYCKITNSIIWDSFDSYWQPPPAIYDPAKAKDLLAEAGSPRGFDAGLFLL